MKSSRTDEGFQLQLGTALKSSLEPYHRCLIVSDPRGNGGYVVLVRITTDDGKWPDRDCILTRADWGGIGARFDGGLFHRALRPG